MLGCRLLAPTEIEGCLQRWGKGKKSNMWLHVDTVPRECPGLGPGAFKGYPSNTEGRSAAERGVDSYVLRIAPTYVFILDRAAGASDLHDVVTVSSWNDFEVLYLQFY